MSITVVVENGTIRLPPSLHVPDGTKVEVTLPAHPTLADGADSAFSWMMKHAGNIEGPEDFATEHDHYIHGTPKRAGQ